MNTAILFITFNRPDTTKQVFEKIKSAQPTRLIIASDGPRTNVKGDPEKVAACRELFIESKITWECEVSRLYNDRNLGCAKGVSQAITQAFKMEERLIILEDDVVPHPTFFTFCTKMLEKYEQDERVMHIAGTRWNLDYNMGEADHFFSTIGHIWGWATWRRAWNKYDYNLKGLPELKQHKTIEKLFNSRKIVNFWLNNFDSVVPNKYTWDYQWQFSLFYNHGLSVVPMVNLISNIGTDGVNYFGEATEHHFRPLQTWVERPTISVQVAANMNYELYHIKDRFLKKPPLYLRALKRLKKMV